MIAFIRSRTLKGAGIVMAAQAVLVAFGPAARFWRASVVNETSFAAASHNVHVITSTVEREGTVYLPNGRVNRVGPGDPYDGYPPELHTVSVTGQAAIAGPYADRPVHKGGSFGIVNLLSTPVTFHCQQRGG